MQTQRVPQRLKTGNNYSFLLQNRLENSRISIYALTMTRASINKQPALLTHPRKSASSHIPNHNPQGGGPETQRENRRLCGCSNVYVLQISNDERIPFHVWAGRALVHTPRPSATHTPGSLRERPPRRPPISSPAFQPRRPSVLLEPAPGSLTARRYTASLRL